MTKKDHKLPVPTGNPWLPSKDDPATVPVPLPVIIVGEHDSKWIWESSKRLARSVVEWEHTVGDTRYKGVSALFGAIATKETRASGILRFHFPPLLIPIIKEPGRFARLRTHFLIGLSGKYAVTLYELLESVANKVEPVLDVPIDTLRHWLKVTEGKLTRYQDFRRFVLEPSIEQINANPLGAGFTVDTQPIKKSRAVHRIRFHVHKVDERRSIEEAMQGNKPPQAVGKKAITSNHLSETLSNQVRLMPSDFERAKAVAPGWDVYFLEQEWREWIAKKGNPEKPGPAFIAFCRKKYQREGSP